MLFFMGLLSGISLSIFVYLFVIYIKKNEKMNMLFNKLFVKFTKLEKITNLWYVRHKHGIRNLNENFGVVLDKETIEKEKNDLQQQKNDKMKSYISQRLKDSCHECKLLNKEKQITFACNIVGQCPGIDLRPWQKEAILGINLKRSIEPLKTHGTHIDTLVAKDKRNQNVLKKADEILNDLKG